MGAFFGSIHIRTENFGAIQEALEKVSKNADCKFQVGPALRGWINVFPDHRGQNDSISAEIAKLVGADVFHLIVHDDDIFIYLFYRDGLLLDQYNSCPDYFGEVAEEEKLKSQGRPEAFQDLLPDPKSLNRLKALLNTGKDKFKFESHRMEQFVELLDLANAMSSYEYLQGGERDEIEGWEQFIHIETQPQSAEDYNHRGEYKRTRGDLEGALADFSRAIEFNPELEAAQKNRAQTERAKSNRDKEMAETWAKFGSIKKAEGELEAALMGCNKAIQLNPQLAKAYNTRARIKRDKHDLDGALLDFNKAIELKPDLAVAYNNRGLIKRAKGDEDAALEDYNKAIELNPSLAEAYTNRGLWKKDKGDFAGSLADYNSALELKPGSAKTYNNRGELKRAKGDLESALADFNKAIELKPDLAVAFNNRGLLMRSKGDLDGALIEYNRAIELKPDLFPAFYNRALVKNAKGDLEGALADFSRAIELKPGLPQCFYNRGDVKRIKRDFDGALADLNKAIELKSDWAEAYNNRGHLKQVKGDATGALFDFDKAIELKPELAAAYSNRGNIRKAKGDLDGALTDYNRALELKPDMAATRKNRDEAVRAKSKPANDRSVAQPGKIPVTENTLALRTDYSDESAWKSLCAAIQNPEDEFTANVEFVSDPQFEGVAAGQLPALLPGSHSLTIAFIIDRTALAQSDHPILVVDLQAEPVRSFRVALSALWEVENNLAIANMEFEEFAQAVDSHGVFRGFGD